MNLHNIARGAGKYITDNSPAILTVLAVTGTVTTAILTGRATFAYMKELAEEGYYDRDYKFERTVKEHVEKAWTLFIPAVITGSITVACVIGANRIGSKRAAMLAAAFTLSEKSFTEYREKITEKLGAKKEQAARDEIAQDQVRRNPPRGDLVVINSGQVLCYEAYAGRYFLSDMESLRKAENDINRQINNDSFASLADLYDMLGLKHTDMSQEMGWNSDQIVEFKFSTVLSEDNRPCISFTFVAYPIRNYAQFH